MIITVTDYTLSGYNITLNGLDFTPALGNILYIENLTQDVIYFAPAPNRAKCSISGSVITINNSFNPLVATDKLHIQIDSVDYTQAISAASLPLPSGAATAAKQLADDHNVTVSNMIPAVETGLATSANQLPDDHNVNVSNMIPPVETGLATSAKQLADNHNVTVSNMIAEVETGLATSAKQDTLLAELQLKADLTETQPVSAASLPLPSGASTSANQTNGSQKVQIVDASGNVIGSSQALDGMWTLNVDVSDTKDNLINRSFIQRLTSTTVASIAAIGATQITVVDGSAFTVGNDLIIEEGLEFLDNHFKVTAKPSANVITLDMPIDIALSVGAVVTEILDSGNVSGSLASPQIFVVAPPSDETWHITRLLFTMTDQTAMDDALFGGITALTNGIVIRKKVGGVYTTHANFKSNSKFADSMYDVSYAEKAPSGYYGIRGRWTIAHSGSVIRLDGANGDQLQLLVQDNLTGLNKMHWNAQGHKQ